MGSAAAEKGPPTFYALIMLWGTIDVSIFIILKVELYWSNKPIFCSTVSSNFGGAGCQFLNCIQIEFSNNGRVVIASGHFKPQNLSTKPIYTAVDGKAVWF